MIRCIGTTPTMQRTMEFEHVVVDDVNRASCVREYASGKSINVARVLKTLGCEPVVSGFAGGDRGEAMRRDLDGAGIHHEFITVAARTRLCTTVLDRSARTATELIEESARVEAAGWDQLVTQLQAAWGHGDRAWIFSGSLPPGAPQDFYARFVKEPHTGAPIIVDGSGEPMRRALQAGGTFVAKMNRRELGLTTGAPVSSDAELLTAARAVTRQCGWALITLGEVGALAAVGERCWNISAPKVDVVSAIGSGDAFVAGMAAAPVLGKTSREEAWRLGAACGVANALTPDAGHVRPDDLWRIYEQVRIKEIEGRPDR